MRTLIMGVLNVTPDSFSDGGDNFDPAAAIAHGQAMLRAGADIVDVGGESTRPGAERPTQAEEMRRVLPVIEALAAARGAIISVDTMRAGVAAAAVRAGARIVNDVSGGLADAAMLATVATLDADYVAMHWRGFLGTGDSAADYDDVVADVLRELMVRRDAALASGIAPERLILDPGLGFSKTAEQSWRLLRSLDRFSSLGHRLLVGASRKRFIGSLLDGRPPKGRDAATAAVSMFCAQHGVWAVRTHEVAANLDAVIVAEELAQLGPEPAVRWVPGGPAGTSRMDDDITLTGIEAIGFHGVNPAERREGQRFVVDVSLRTQLETASDRLADTINYAEVAHRVEAIITGDPVDLIETLAGRIADDCLRESRVHEVHVTVHKPQAPVHVRFADISVSISRRRAS